MSRKYSLVEESTYVIGESSHGTRFIFCRRSGAVSNEGPFAPARNGARFFLSQLRAAVRSRGIAELRPSPENHRSPKRTNERTNGFRLPLSPLRHPFSLRPEPHRNRQSATMSRALLRSVLELRTPVTRLPPSFLLPFRPAAAPAARFLHQTAQQVEPTSQSDAAAAATLFKASSPKATTTPTTPETPAAPSAPSPISQQVRKLLPVLAAQPGHYTTIHIHGKPYLVTEGDTVKLPFKMPGVAPGDVLRLNKASVIGSRDLTLQGAPYVDERLFECRAVVMGTESEPMRVMIKKKRRCRKKKHVFSKHKYTVLRINQLKINDVSNL